MRQFLLRKFKILHTIWKETVIIIKYGIFAKKKKREREKRRGRKEIEVTWRRKGRVKRGESNQASNQISK